MNPRDKRFDTVDQLVEYVLSNPYNAKTRYKLHSVRSQEYVDPQAGEAWEQEWKTLTAEIGDWWNESDDMTPDQKQENARRRSHLHDFKPRMKDVYDWQLEETGGYSYRRPTIRLSRELGGQINATWTTRKSRYGGMDRVGTVSLETIVKRLGKTDIAKQVAQVQAETKARLEKNQRNTARGEAERLAKQLVDLMEKHPEIDWPEDLAGLASIAREE